MNYPKLHLVLTFIAAFLLSACAPQLPPAPADLQLSGTSWVLQSLDDYEQLDAVEGEEPITINFPSDTEVNGYGGCNSYSGSYDADPQTASIVFTDLVSTLMACESSTLGNLETLYYEALNAAASYEVSTDAIPVTGDTLTITGGGHTLIFVTP